jgi:hypothetical protein
MWSMPLLRVPLWSVWSVEKVCVFRGSSTVGCDGEIVDAGGVAGEEADRTAGRHLLATSG